MTIYLVMADNGESYEDRSVYPVCYFDYESEADQFVKDNLLNKRKGEEWQGRYNDLLMSAPTYNEPYPIKPQNSLAHDKISNENNRLANEAYFAAKTQYYKRRYDFDQKVRKDIEEKIGPQIDYHPNCWVETLEKG